MKKNIKTTVLAIALMVGVTGAYAADLVKAFKGKANLAEYSWQKYNRNQTPNGSPVLGDETNPFPEDCPNGSLTRCAEGTPVGGGASIIVYYPL
nr:hypothetical protein [Pedobacter panaciterrae]